MDTYQQRRRLLETRSFREVSLELDRIICEKGTLDTLDDEPFLDKFIVHLTKLSSGNWAYSSPRFLENFLLDLFTKYPRLHKRLKCISMYGALTNTSKHFFEWNSLEDRRAIIEENQFLSPVRALNPSFQKIFKDRHDKLD